MKLDKQKVRDRLQELGLTQKQLAQRADISYPQIRKYLTQDVLVPQKKIKSIADCLDVDYLEIIQFAKF